MDNIRVIACFMVVFYHFTVAIPQFPINLGAWGRCGTGLFFMISGYALINSTINKFNTNTFYKKRIISIYIPFYIAYFGTYAYYFVKNNFANPFIAKKWTFIFTILGIDGYLAPLGKNSFYILGEWFLAVIIFIYAIFPLWRKLFLKLPAVTAALLFVLRALLIIGIIPSPVILCFNVIPALSYFTLGAYFKILFDKTDFSKFKKYIIALIGVLSLVIGIIMNYKLIIPDVGEIFDTVGIFLIIFFISDFIKNKAANSFVSFISSISYEIFLVHHVIIYIFTPYVSAAFGKKSFVLGGAFIALSILFFAYGLKKVSDPISKYAKKLLLKKQ